MKKPVEKATYEKRYNSARWDIMLFIALTVLNIGVVLLGDEMRYISAGAIPLFLITLGKIMCGKMDNSFYVGEYANIEFMDDLFLVGMIAAAVLIVGVYLLLWFLSKNYIPALIIAGALIIIDTVSMFFIYNVFDLFLLCDYAIHVLMIAMIIYGTHAGFKLKKIREDEAAFVAAMNTRRDQFANRQ